MAISNALISTTATAVYTSTGDNAVTTIIVCNTASFDSGNPTLGQTELFLYAVPDGKTPAGNPETIIVNGLPIPAGETVSLDQEKMVLADGDKLYAKSASPANLVITVSTLQV